MGDTEDIFSKIRKREDQINRREINRQISFGSSVRRQISLKELGRMDTIELGYEVKRIRDRG